MSNDINGILCEIFVNGVVETGNEKGERDVCKGYVKYWEDEVLDVFEQVFFLSKTISYNQDNAEPHIYYKEYPILITLRPEYSSYDVNEQK